MKTSFVYNGEDRVISDKETFIVFGCARGGTSMVAGCLVGLGLHMGNNLPQNYEDPEFVNKSPSQMIATIGRKNQHHDRWGWKYPEAGRYLGQLIDGVKNPRLIIVYRDLVAIANKQNTANSISFTDSLVANALLQNQNLYFSLQSRLPTFAVSYEKALSNNNEFLIELAEFVNLPLPEDTQNLVNFMRPGEYKSTFADRYVT